MSLQTYIPESHVQEIISTAFNRYHYKTKSVFIATEAQTITSKRADVFFAFKRSSSGIYISVVEAKSKMTLSDLKPQASYRRRVIWARVILFLLIITVFFLLDLKIILDGFSIIFFLTSIFLMIGLIGWMLIKTGSKLALSIPAIDQLDKYPAHEKWIAIAADTFSYDSDYTTLYRYCKKANIGLLVVDEYGRIEDPLWPVPGNEIDVHLDKYKGGSEIKEYLLSGFRNYRTPSEKRKSFRYWLNIGFVFLVGVSLLYLMSSIDPRAKINYNNSRFSESEPRVERFLPIEKEKTEKKKSQLKKRRKEREVDAQEYEGNKIVAEYFGQPCSFFEVEKRTYLVVTKICKTQSIVNEHITKLNEIGLEDIQYVKSECLNSWVDNSLFVIHTNELFDVEEEAKAKALELSELLEDHDIKRPTCISLTLKEKKK